MHLRSLQLSNTTVFCTVVMSTLTIFFDILMPISILQTDENTRLINYLKLFRWNCKHPDVDLSGTASKVFNLLMGPDLQNEQNYKHKRLIILVHPLTHSLGHFICFPSTSPPSRLPLNSFNHRFSSLLRDYCKAFCSPLHLTILSLSFLYTRNNSFLLHTS